MTPQRGRLIPRHGSDNHPAVCAAIAALAGAVALAGCGSRGGAAGGRVDDGARDARPGAASRDGTTAPDERTPADFTARVAPTDTVAVARPGRKLVLPVTPERGFVPAAGAIVRLDDGVRIKARLWWIAMKPAPWDERVRAATDPIRAWLAESPGGAAGWGVWSATPGDDVQPEAAAGAVAAEAGQWVLIADLPRDSAAQRLWVGEGPSAGVPIVWWTGLEPEHLSLFGDDAPMWVRSPWLTRTLSATSSSPLTRWRADLIAASLGLRIDVPVSPSAPADPVLDVLGERMTTRWTAALVRLEGLDPALARRTLWAAAGVADFGGAVVAPLWTDDAAELAALVAGVLDPDITDDQAAARAEAWLASRAPTLAWVIDDAGAPEPATLRPVVTLGVLNRALTTEPASVEADSARGSAVFAATPPVSTRRMNVPVPRAEASAGATRLSVRMNDRTLTRSVAAAPAQVLPPGLRIGPLVRDWTHARFVAAAGDPEPGPSELGVVDARWSTAALLQRAAPGGGLAWGTPEADRAGVRPEWTLYVECRVGPTSDDDAADPRRDSIRLWLGAFGAPSFVLRVAADGTASVEDSRSRAGSDWTQLSSAAGGVTVRRTDTGWACWIPIPAGAIEPDGTIKLALERTDPSGVRSAWPRAMLPWQREPGRAWADLGAWEGAAR